MDVSFLNENEIAVLEFAKQAHGEQVRKYTNEPYWYHLVSVAKRLKEHVTYSPMICIALLHDVLEDTEKTIADIYDIVSPMFNECETEFIISGVVALTDRYTKEVFPTLKRVYRKRLEAQRLAQIHSSYQTIKYCDLLDNLESIVQNDKGFAKVYVVEKRDILIGMWNGHTKLYSLCTDAVQQSFELLKD